MRKIRLDLGRLSVDSFETASAPTADGTVHGHAAEGAAAAATIACTQFCSVQCTDTCALKNTEYASCQVNCGCTRLGMAC
jgi:hypothetical protein